MSFDHTDLREMKKRQDIDGLLNILETGDIKECCEVICMLGELKTRKAITPLIGFLETDDIQIRSNAAWALGEIGHVKSVLPLIGLMNDPIENVRINAAWALGRIGDKRALSVLKSAIKNGSTDLRKHANEAIARIESNGNDKLHRIEEPDISDSVDIPLITIEVTSDMECNYMSRVEDDESQTDYENTTRIGRNVQIRDTGDLNRFSGEDTRKVLLGLKNGSRGLVSVDILLRYKENSGGERQTSSVWLQMSGAGRNGNYNTALERDDARPKNMIRRESSKRKARVKHSIKNRSGEYDLHGEIINDPFKKSYDIPEICEEQESGSWVEDDIRETIKPARASRMARETEDDDFVPENQELPESTRPETGVEKTLHEVKQAMMSPQKANEKPEQVEPEVSSPPSQPAAAKIVSSSVPGGNVDSAVRLLSNIGMSGMTNAASTVTQLSGEEADSLHSQLRTLPIDEMKDEITGLGESVVMISVELHGKGQAGELNGQMQMYLSCQNALDVANELLCNTPETAIKEFNDDITSTLKETANIFGGQYISAISEYIEMPLLLKAPSFRTGPASKVAESVLKDITGKVEFALATNLSFGNNKTGRLIMLVDPKSFDTIIKKLFG